MGDLLSASSLLMAIAAILFSLWYAEIAKALEIAPKSFREDNIQSLKMVTNTMYTKAIPVAIMATLVSVIFLPDAINLFLESLAIYRKSVWGSIFKGYDAVRTAYCFVSLLSMLLAFYMARLVVKLSVLKRRLT